ncbi:copper chaperone PCu(A)C [Neiella marina]|uniref:Copper chaperone PCu(A)C n=1 Tax=Neiella holothuriorum TaxID=2870530 RepID=A0ABS7EFT6_9GAMM|nr:copper chaperone PCu(A)C [Neiella holothuriorum]MBW8191075.1 copper chaperone PCu(A)C [Neiella holothuriorum]
MIKRVASALLSLAMVPAIGCELTVEDAYVRAPIPGVPNTAAFLRINNSCSEPVSLIAGQASAAKSVELHTHIHEDGMMKMRQVDAIIVAANDSVELKPGGYHLMMFEIDSALKDAKSTPILLTFSNGQQVEFVAPLQDLMSKHHHH